MSQVWSCNEWDPLEEVIVGNPLGARFPYADPSTRLAEYPDRDLADIPQGAFPDQIIEESKSQSLGFNQVLITLITPNANSYNSLSIGWTQCN